MHDCRACVRVRVGLWCGRGCVNARVHGEGFRTAHVTPHRWVGAHGLTAGRQASARLESNAGHGEGWCPVGCFNPLGRSPGSGASWVRARHKGWAFSLGRWPPTPTSKPLSAPWAWAMGRVAVTRVPSTTGALHHPLLYQPHAWGSRANGAFLAKRWRGLGGAGGSILSSVRDSS